MSKRSLLGYVQFGTRSFLIFMLAFCVWLGIARNQVRIERNAIANITKQGGFIGFDWQRSNGGKGVPPGPQWLRDLFGDEYFQDVVVVTFWSKPATDLSALAHLPEIRWLAIPRIDRPNLSALQNLRKLKWLCLSDASVDDLSSLSSLTGLETIYLDGVGTSDLSPLCSLCSLRELYIEDSDIGRRELRRFAIAIPLCKIYTGFRNGGSWKELDRLSLLSSQ